MAQRLKSEDERGRIDASESGASTAPSGAATCPVHEGGAYPADGVAAEAQRAGLRKRTRIVLLTARDLSSHPEREQQFMDFSHADAVLYKPFEMDELVARSRALLDSEAETAARAAA